MQKVYAPGFIKEAIKENPQKIKLKRTFNDNEAAAIRSLFAMREDLLNLDKGSIEAETEKLLPENKLTARLAAMTASDVAPIVANCITCVCIEIMDAEGVYQTTLANVFPDIPEYLLSVSKAPATVFYLPHVFAHLNEIKEAIEPCLKEEVPHFKPGDVAFGEFIAPMLPGFERESKLSEPWPKSPAAFPADADKFSDEKAQQIAYDMVGRKLDAETARATIKQNIESLWARWREERDAFMARHKAEIAEDVKTIPLLEKCARYNVIHFINAKNYEEDPNLPLAPVETATRVVEKMALAKNLTNYRAPHAYAALQATKPDLWLKSIAAKKDKNNPSSLVEVKAATPKQIVRISFLPPESVGDGNSFMNSEEYISENGVLSKYDEWVNAICCTLYDRGERKISLTQLIRAILVDDNASPTKLQRSEAIASILRQEGCRVVIELSYKYDEDADMDDAGQPMKRTIMGRYLPCKIEEIVSKTGKILEQNLILLDRPPIMQYSELSNNQIQTISRKLMAIRDTEVDSKGNLVLLNSRPTYSKNFISVLWYTVRRYLDYESTSNTIKIDTLIKGANIVLHKNTERVEKARVINYLKSIFDCWIAKGEMDSYTFNKEGRNHSITSVTFYVTPEHKANSKALEGQKKGRKRISRV